MRPFAYHQPDSLEEVFSLLDTYSYDAKLISGGTALINLMKQQLVQPDQVISLQNLSGLSDISVEGRELTVGALVTARQIEKSELVKSSIPLLAEAYSRVATVRIRERATLGGGLAHADAAMDSPAVWQVLDAQIHLQSSQGKRTIPAREFYEDFLTTVIEPEEMVTGISAPLPAAGSKWSYQKFLPRSKDDYATVSVAVLMQTAADGRIEHATIGLGSCGPTPMLATESSARLVGQVPTPELLSEISEVVMGEIDPLDDIRGSADYKKSMARVFTRRALEEALA